MVSGGPACIVLSPPGVLIGHILRQTTDIQTAFCPQKIGVDLLTICGILWSKSIRRCALSNVIELAKRRRQDRFQVRSSAFVVYNSNKLGRIVDISMHGLSFSHVESDRSPGELRELDIFLIDSDFYLENVPIETSSIVKTYQPDFSSIYLGRYSVQFGKLTKNQRSQLEFLIRNHTTQGA